MRNRIDPRMCDILQEGLLTYFKGESVTTAMLRIRGQEGYERYDLLIDEQTVIGWDNLLRGNFSKQWKIQQRRVPCGSVRVVVPVQPEPVRALTVSLSAHGLFCTYNARKLVEYRFFEDLELYGGHSNLLHPLSHRNLHIPT
jgi:hypothetical protein